MPSLLLANEVPLSTILIALLGVIATVVIGLIVISQVKKQLASDEDEEKGQPGGFTLSDLRDLHKDGQMSDEEFARAKGKIIESARRAAERDKPKDQGKPERPPLS